MNKNTNPDLVGMTHNEKEIYYKRKYRERKKIKDLEEILNKDKTNICKINWAIRVLSKNDSDIELKVVLLKNGGGSIKLITGGDL